MISKKIWRILLDFDGTLHDTNSIFYSKFDGILGLDGKTLFNIYMFDIHREIVHYYYPDKHNDLDFHWKLLFNHLKKPIDNSIMRLLTLRFTEAINTINENPRFFKDVFEFIDGANRSEYQLCLSTGGGAALRKVKLMTKFFGFDYFGNYFFDEEILKSLKTEKAYYQKILARYSWKVENVVSIGDCIETDIYPAKLLGIKTILVDRNNQQDLSDPKKNPDYRTNNLISALDYLNSNR
jgi:FMN phosphatase YigB (HAD superfamily)